MFAYNKMLNMDGVGLGMFLLPYQMDALEYLYTVGEANSRQVWIHVNRVDAPDPKSRASVINYLQGMAEEGLVSYRDATGKGGHHRVYMPSLEYPTLDDLTHELINRLLAKLSKEFNMAIQYAFRKGHTLIPGKEEF